ncbi:MAG TPA: thioredoxin fold domain-containing protein [Burkholderiales bacterium]|nr:thioredoxin fold domain-containing protein [Burkholderiales bacterium]
MKAATRLLALGAVLLAALAHAKTPAPAELAALYARMETVDAVAEGPASAADRKSRTLYVFFDANCWYCHLTWKALQHYERAGLQVRWIPVAYQKDSSFGRAAAIMNAADRAAAMRENETGYRAASYDGAIAPAAVSKDLKAQLVTNTMLMQQMGAPGTPLLVWKDAQGAVRTKVGMPRLSQLPAITGLPRQRIDDPELADFR